MAERKSRLHKSIPRQSQQMTQNMNFLLAFLHQKQSRVSPLPPQLIYCYDDTVRVHLNPCLALCHCGALIIQHNSSNVTFSQVRE